MYGRCVGSLTYMSISAHPQLATVLSMLARVLHEPTKNACEALAHTMVYIKQNIVDEEKHVLTYGVPVRNEYARPKCCKL